MRAHVLRTAPTAVASQTALCYHPTAKMTKQTVEMPSSVGDEQAQDMGAQLYFKRLQNATRENNKRNSAKRS